MIARHSSRITMSRSRQSLVITTISPVNASYMCARLAASRRARETSEAIASSHFLIHSISIRSRTDHSYRTCHEINQNFTDVEFCANNDFF